MSLTLQEQNTALRAALGKSELRVAKLQRRLAKYKHKASSKNLALFGVGLSVLSGLGFFAHSRFKSSLEVVRGGTTAEQRSQAFLTLLAAANNDSKEDAGILLNILRDRMVGVPSGTAEWVLQNQDVIFTSLVAAEKTHPGVLYAALVSFGRRTLRATVPKTPPASHALTPADIVEPKTVHALHERKHWSPEVEKKFDRAVRKLLLVIVRSDPTLLFDVLKALHETGSLPSDAWSSLEEIGAMKDGGFVRNPEQLIVNLMANNSTSGISVISSLIIRALQLTPRLIQDSAARDLCDTAAGRELLSALEHADRTLISNFLEALHNSGSLSSEARAELEDIGATKKPNSPSPERPKKALKTIFDTKLKEKVLDHAFMQTITTNTDIQTAIHTICTTILTLFPDYPKLLEKAREAAGEAAGVPIRGVVGRLGNMIEWFIGNRGAISTLTAFTAIWNIPGVPVFIMRAIAVELGANIGLPVITDDMVGKVAQTERDSFSDQIVSEMKIPIPGLSEYKNSFTEEDVRRYFRNV
jgi:hypothetical protein